MVLRYYAHSIHHTGGAFAYWANRGREGFVGTISKPLVQSRPSVPARLERRAKLACEKELPKGPVARVRCPNGVGKLEDLSEVSTFKTTTTRDAFQLSPQQPPATTLTRNSPSPRLLPVNRSRDFRVDSLLPGCLVLISFSLSFLSCLTREFPDSSR